MTAEAVTCKVLVRDGKWLVPPEERPANWRTILPEPGSPSILDEVSVATEEREAEPKLPECGCGRPGDHRGQCSWRAAEFRRRRQERFGGLLELLLQIEAVAKEWGAAGMLLLAAKVMVAGMWTRDRLELASVLRVTPSLIDPICKRYEACMIWSDPHAVHLGDENDKIPDLGFWLNAMVGTGEIALFAEGDTPKYALAEAKS